MKSVFEKECDKSGYYHKPQRRIYKNGWDASKRYWLKWALRQKDIHAALLALEENGKRTSLIFL